MFILKSFNLVFACKNTTIFHKSVKLRKIFNLIFLCVHSQIVRNSSLAKCASLSRITANVVAAWRQAGASVRLGREQMMMLPALYQTSLYPRLRETARCV